LEVGEVLSDSEFTRSDQGDGEVLRGMTAEDELLWERIERNRDKAFQACSALLDKHAVPAVLMDVEHLFDGQSIFFYFLGEPPSGVANLEGELANAYEAKVQFRRFSEAVTAGCGPGCGTAEAENGCQTGACSTCSIASACGVR
jgi:cell fate regulator YaaT (PSP1 superfamily)